MIFTTRGQILVEQALHIERLAVLQERQRRTVQWLSG